jgi:hypothetical protein
MQIIIDRDFQYLLPELDEKTFSDLEADILENGIRDSLVLWDGILIDGYNRYKIAQMHDLPFNTVSMDFASRDEAMIWIIWNQIIRRNLTPFQLRYFRGLHYHADRRITTNEEGLNQYSEVERQNGVQPQTQSTARKLAEKYNVSPRTIDRDSRLADALIVLGEVSPDAKMSILSGETKVTRAELDALLTGSEETAIEIAKSIDNGTFAEHRAIDAQRASTESMSLDSAFSRISDIIKRELTGLSRTYSPSEVKNALRSHIKALEDLYEQI